MFLSGSTANCGNKRLQITCLICLCLLIQSCAISKKTCLQDDWQTVGYRDGRAGKSPEVISSYTDTCAKHGVVPDVADYSVGFKSGIKLYCTPANGFDEGVDNERYSGACPADLEPDFLDSYIEGLRLALQDLEIDYDRQSFELDRLRAHRDSLADKGLPHSRDDKRIQNAESALRKNTRERREINQRIRKWRSRL